MSKNNVIFFAQCNIYIWGCIKTNLAIFGGMNIHSPVIWGSLGYQGFDSYPYIYVHCVHVIYKYNIYLYIHIYILFCFYFENVHILFSLWLVNMIWASLKI
jgi:hypothetical protein